MPTDNAIWFGFYVVLGQLTEITRAETIAEYKENITVEVYSTVFFLKYC
jgi:hypothetical protein